MSGYLDRGAWRPGWHDTRATGGEFVRPDAGFRGQLPAGAVRREPGRYHLYVSLACPWAHRTLVYRALLGLQDALPVHVVEPVMDDEGWAFSAALPDRLHGFHHLHQLYTAARPDCSGRVTVPVLWDAQARTIVNNESSEILRLLDDGDIFRPAALRDEIDRVNAYVYGHVNNGVYRCGFASSQAAYEAAFDRLFLALDALEARLASSRYVAGAQVTEADWRLFTTLVRFDAVYHGHFKCNRQRLVDYVHLPAYVRELFQWPGVAATVDLDHIKRHYHMSHPHLNPGRIVPKGPALDFMAPHGRDGRTFTGALAPLAEPPAPPR